MAQVRLLTGRFLKVDGEVLEDFEAIAGGTIENVPARTGTSGCSFGVGHFLPRL